MQNQKDRENIYHNNLNIKYKNKKQKQIDGTNVRKKKKRCAHI